MHGSLNNKVRLSSVVQSQLPLFAQDNYPFLVEFLEEYYRYLENPGQAYDLLTNPDSYTKLDFVADSIATTELVGDIDAFTDTITVSSTKGYPFENGLLKIDDEIIYYKSKTLTTFDECTRGFSGVTNYDTPGTTDTLTFAETNVAEHTSGALVSNLNALLLDEFFTKLKIQFAPGFENLTFADGLNQSLFIKQLKDFYNSKGTDDSFIILFKALYGATPKIVRPRDFLFAPSDADYRKTLNLVVEEVIGDPNEIVSRVLYQDAEGDTPKAYGTVVGVEQFEKNDNEYYTVKLDYGYNRDLDVTGTVFGEFSVHSQTQTVDNIGIGASVITVDTTLGFSDSGELLVLFNGDEDLDIDDEYMIVNYDGVNVNQFLNVTGVTRPIEAGWTVGMNSYVYSYDDDEEEVRMRVSGVLGELKEVTQSSYSEIGDYAKVWKLGKATNDLKASEWMFNHAISNRVAFIEDEGNNNYAITVYDKCRVNGGDKVLVNCDVRNIDGSLERIEKEFEASPGPTPDDSFRIINDREIVEAFYVKRKITKAKGTEIAANVQNVYIDLEGDAYVATNSLPNYFNEDLQLDYRDVVLSGAFSSQKTITVENHGLYTGDALFYDASFSESNSLNITGNLFAYRVDENNFKLAKSLSNLETENFIELTGFADYAKLVRPSNYRSGRQLEVKPQIAMRKISNPRTRTEDAEVLEIESEERVGILKNGVEIVTYKSPDFCFFGGIESVVVNAGGGGYDIINPPVLNIIDSNGSGFEGDVTVKGGLLKINIEDPGMDYLTFSDVIISGGNPSKPATAIPNFKSKENKEFFRSDLSTKVSLTNNTIQFDRSHKFREGDEVTYSSEGEVAIGGLDDSNVYFVNIVDAVTISLHNTKEEGLEGKNPVGITTLGVGNHSITATQKRLSLESISISDIGEGYNNNKVIVQSAGINTANYTIKKSNHLFKNDDEIIYEHSGSAISGLASTITYYAEVIDENTFALFEKNDNADLGDAFINRGKRIEIASKPSGYHTFKAPPLTVEITGTVGVSSIVEPAARVKLNPLFRGEVIKVEIKEKGSEYGSPDILNFEKQPRYSLLTGQNAILQPVIFDGQLESVVVLAGGRNYNAAPEVTLFENDPDLENSQTVVVPIVENGAIKEVKILEKGTNYSQTPKFYIETPGDGCKLKFNIKSWNVDEVEKLIKSKSITSDDSYLVKSLDSNLEMQYTHLYSPRKLRGTLYSQKFEEGLLKYRTDLENDRSENAAKYHSPILGWAYDGSPIYGPYGYSSASGGSIKQLTSGYGRVDIGNRPNFPLGFFVEDNTFTGNGDLDENNGRFCITPEYPKGVYAYFTTVSEEIQATGDFSQNKSPQFPYVVGKNLKYSPITFNYNTLEDTNQVNFDFDDFGCRRNTTPYNLKQWYSGYDYLIQPDQFDAHFSKVESLSGGQVDDIDILEKGDGYKVGDFVKFDNVGTGGTGASASVSEVVGKTVTSIALSETYIKGKAFQSQNNLVISCNEELGFADTDLVTVIGLSTEHKLAIDTDASVIIPKISFILNKNIGESGTTGPVTFLPVKTESLSKVRENDIIQVEDEKMKVLNVDVLNSRLRVLREYDGTVGVAHSLENSITHIPTRFEISLNTQNGSINKEDRELYFNPVESVGLGTTSGLGITTALYFSSPGAGITYLDIPTRSIYLPAHGLQTGEKIFYYSNTGDNIAVSTSGIGSTTLFDNTELFVFKFDENRIGISTVRLGVGTDGDREPGHEVSFVGVGTNVNASPFYLVGLGTGEHHSFQTLRDHASVEISRTSCTVSTAETHGLEVGDRFRTFIFQGGIKEYDVFYNDVTNRMLVDETILLSSNIDIENNQIKLNDHPYRDGDKVIAFASQVDGLDNNRIYYTNYISKDIFSLSSSYEDSIGEETKTVDLTTVGSVRLRLVNPEIRSIKNETIKFNLSDSSLSYIDGTTSKPAFDFKVFVDSGFKNEYLTDSDGNFVVTSTGTIGITTDASVSILVNELTPNQLYYRLIPKSDLGLTQDKKDIIIDSYKITDGTKISILNNNICGNHVVASVATSSFTFDTPKTIPGITSFTSSDSSIEYVTNSFSATGPIHDILLTNPGANYNTVVGLTTVISEGGSGSKIRSLSESIGATKVFKTENVGWDYPSDPTLSPTAKLPDVLLVDQKFAFDKITRLTSGLNYNVAPDLVVRDSVSKNILSDLLLNYNLDGTVKIVKNTSDLSNDTPIIIPINNSNGFSIKNISIDNTTKIATLFFKTSFSLGATFPFTVGNNVLIEGCASKTSGSSGRTFNSADFSYDLFEITEIDPNFGGSGASIKVDMSKSVGTAETLGEYDNVSATGVVVPESYFPTFSVDIKRVPYISGEIIVGRSSGAQAEVQLYDENAEILKVFGEDYFELGEEIVGEKSGTVSIIDDINLTDLYYNIDSSAVVIEGFNNNKGFLNYSEYKIQDSFYYQKFSYAIQSTVTENIWEEEVERLNHLVGWKRFSDMSIESQDLSYSGISTSQDQGNFVSIADFSRVVDTNCVFDFDITVDETLLIGNKRFSTGIVFNSRDLQDFNKSVGNRVLVIDDISDSFNSNPRGDQFSVIDSFKFVENRARKYLTFARDSRFTDQRQVDIVTVIHNGSEYFMNQYGRVETVYDLGSFDFAIFEDEANLRFYPEKFEVNDYDLSFISHSISDFTSGIGTTSFGDIVEVELHNSNVSGGATTTIATIPTDYRSTKFLIEIEEGGGIFEFDELSLIHDGTTVTFQEYGQLTTDTLNEYSTDGIGTYHAYIDGSNIKLDLIPSKIAVSADVNALAISIASSESGFTTQGSTEFTTAIVESTYTSIASTQSTGGNEIATYFNGILGIDDYSSGYYIVSIDDKTNQKYQVSELVVVSSSTSAFYSEYGQVYTDGEVGVVTAGIAGTITSIYFTANDTIDAEVRVYAQHLGIRDQRVTNNQIDMINADIVTGNADYQGTQNAVLRDFELFNEGNPIFQKKFDGSDIGITSVTQDTIELPQHFFVTGEEVVYSFDTVSGPIGIASTDIPGIGVTDKLPSTLFIVKQDELLVKVASSATEALALRPTTLDITGVGIGSGHFITAKNQNPKTLITIDNMIQSPVVSTATTTGVGNTFTTIDDVLTLTEQPERFFSGDFIQIDDEIIRVSIVGYGGSDNDVYVQRAVLGTKLADHVQFAEITKIIGNYNIVDNTISFADAPYGKSPIGSPDNPPDERDYTGITTFSRFSGRSFMRNGPVDSTSDPYYQNYIFDGIEDQFTGIKSSFELKVEGQSIDGISASNAIITVNDLFQSPKVDQSNVDIAGNYSLEEGSGTTNIIFDESEYTREDDITIKGLPVGGRIVSVGSTKGFGYQSLVSAGATATVSSAGTISAVNITAAGGGYRTGIQTNIEVYIREETVEASNKVAIGTALVTRGRVTGVAVTNSQVFYAPRNISNVEHTTTTGLTTVTTSTAHGLSVGNEVVLSDVGEIINSPTLEYVSVRAINSDTEFEINTGVTTDSYSYSSGGKVEKYFTVDFDDPLPYSNLPTSYSTTSIGDTGGRSAKVNVVVGQGSSVIDFDITNVGYGYEINNVLTVSVGGTDGIQYMYHGRFADAGNLLASNRQFLVKEAVGYATATYPALLANPDYDQTKCERDTGFIVDALANDLFFGGNSNAVAAGNKYWSGPLNYVTGETTETIATYDYLAGISTFVINNQTLPTSYQGIAVSVTQVTDTTIDYNTGSSYTLDSCSDVVSSIYNLVGIVTTIIGDGVAYAPPVLGPHSTPILSLPTTLDFEEFNFYITQTQTDQFTGWTIGDLQVIDDISSQFNGEFTRFAIKINGVRTSIKAATGSLIDVQATLLIFINDVLQVPGEAYVFPGGSTIRFTEAPKLGDTCKIIFYRGTGDIDVEFVDILETVSPGDLLTIDSGDLSLKQTDRSVKDVTSTDSVDTYLYGGVGISNDPFVERPVNWCRATTDLIIDGSEVNKARDIYEAAILPLTNIIYDVGAASTQIWIEGVRTFFDNAKENTTDIYINTVDLISQDLTSEAVATASVTAGIVTQINITNTGNGYFEVPSISIGKPKDDGGDQAEATTAISSGKLTTITVSTGGTGYDDNNPPPVLITPPVPKSETVFRVDFAGDFGEVIGIGTTTIGAGTSQGLVFEFAIPENSPLKNEVIVGTGNTIDYSGIGTGDFFTIRDSTVGNATTVGYGVTSIEIDGVNLINGTAFIDNVYQVHDIIPGTPIVILQDDFIASLTRLGSYSVGSGNSTTVADGATLIIEDNTKVVTVVEDYSQLGLSSFRSRQTFANFSWGRLDNIVRPNPETYEIKRDNGLVGIDTSPILRRKNPLKALNYLS